MNVFIVHAHPEPRSMNGAMTRTAVEELGARGHQVKVSDLHAMGFNPVMGAGDFDGFADGDFLKYQMEQERACTEDKLSADIAAEIEKCQWADLLILQFPISWFSVPGILKGWIDRVFVRGTFYGAGRTFERGGMQGKRAMLSLTTGGLPPMFSETGRFGGLYPLMFHLNYGSLRFVGYDVLDPFVVYGPARIGQDAREAYLDQWRTRLASVEDEAPIPYPLWDQFDENFQWLPGHEHALHTLRSPVASNSVMESAT
jgi:NAD(P)H dehydrogenase (quinone)